MDPSPSRVRLRALIRSELRALPRNSFALGAVGFGFGLLTVPISFFMVGEGGLDETLMFTWFVLPLVVAIPIASRVAGARRTRFVDSLYTTPLTQPTWFAAQAIVGAVLGFLILAIQVPALLVHIAWLGVPDYLLAMALAALGVAAFAVALGLFCGVIVGDASSLAAAGLAGGIGFVAFVLFIIHTVELAEPPSQVRDLMLRITALSPMALAADASHLSINNAEPMQGWRPAVGLALLTAGLTAAAWLAYTRVQSPLGWEAGRAFGRITVVAVAALAIAAPVATAEVDFVETGPGYGYEPGEHTWVAFAKRGAPVPDAFTWQSIFDSPDLPLDQDVAYDALVLVVAPPGAALRGVEIDIQGSSSVRVIDGGMLRVPSGQPDAQSTPPDGEQARPVYRVPVTLRATSVEELGNSPAPVEVHTRFTASGQPWTSTSHVLLAAEIPGAVGQVMGAGLVLPAAALAGLAHRKWRTR